MSPREGAKRFLGRTHQRELTEMGRRESNSRQSFSDFATGKETVGEMVRRGFTVAAACPTCRVWTAVDLDSLVTLKGPSLTFWNRRGRCKTIIGDDRCAGAVRFYAKLGSGQCAWFPLHDPPRTPTIRDELTGRIEPPPPDAA